ncbi:MAG: transposase [Nitrososphaeraceae archaeon]|nr:transposase [Nitrososphaeraceae archaeon]
MGIQIQGTKEKICECCFYKGKEEIQKRVKRILSNLKQGWTVIVQDESIFVYDHIFKRKKWISADKRPIVTVTGCRKKTIVFGCLSIKGKQLFLQYDKFNSSIFIDYLKQIQKQFGKCIVFVYRATPHCSKITGKYLAENKDTIRVEYFPVGSQEFNAVEECWRQGKYNILSCYYSTFDSLKDAISSYCRTRSFNLDVIKYLTRSTY